MASKKKFEGQEVIVSAPRMGHLEKGLYDRSQMTPKQKKDEALDMAVGFSGPVSLAKGIDLRKMSKLKRWGQDLASRVVGSGADNVAQAAIRQNDDKKYARGGRIDGIAKRGKTKGRIR